MRGIAVVVAVVLAIPLVGSLYPAPPARVDPPLLPKDFRDADLLRLLAAKEGDRPSAQALRAVPAGTTLDGMVTKLAERAGKRVTSADLAPFAKLDPSVAGPTTLLLFAVDQAWTMRDQAFAKLSLDEQRELLARLEAHQDDARTAALAAQVDEPTLIKLAFGFEQGTKARHAPRFLSSLGTRDFVPRDTGVRGGSTTQRARQADPKAKPAGRNPIAGSL